jgi:periplasmic protein CpxP/Spy
LLKQRAGDFMNKLARLSIASAIVCGLVFSGQSFAVEAAHADAKARQCKHMNKGGAQAKFERLSKNLDLNEEQKATIKAQREVSRDTNKAQHEQLKMARQALMAATEAGADDAKLQSLANDVGQLQGQEAYSRAQNKKAFLAVLTAEQKIKMQEMKVQRGDKFDSMKKH